MTVKELIEELKKYPEDAEISIHEEYYRSGVESVRYEDNSFTRNKFGSMEVEHVDKRQVILDTGSGR